MHTKFPLTALLILNAALLPILGFPATFNVSVSSNSGAGSLRQAMTSANTAGGANTITFSPALANSTITLAASLPLILNNLTIDGSGASNITISGNNMFRGFVVDSGFNAVIQGLTLSNMKAQGGQGGPGDSGGVGMGGSIFVMNNATLTITGGQFAEGSLKAGVGGFNHTSGQGGNGSTCGQEIFLMSGGSLIFNLTSNVTIPNPIQSDQGAGGGGSGGGLTLEGMGILTLNGLNTFTGATTINGGALNLNGVLVTNVTVNSGGLFGGNATVPALANSGIVIPRMPGTLTGIGEINISGNYTQNPNGSLTMVINPSQADVLNVSGTSSLNGTLNVTAVAGNYIKGQTYTIIQGDGPVDGTFAVVNLPSVPQLGIEYFSNSVQLIVLNNKLFVLRNVDSGNSTQVANYLEEISILFETDLAHVVQELGMLDSPSLNSALNQLNPALFGVFELVNLETSSFVSSLMQNHVFELACSPRECSRKKRSHTEIRKVKKVKKAENNTWANFFGFLSSDVEEEEISVEEPQIVEESVMVTVREKRSRVPKRKRNSVWLQPFGIFAHNDRIQDLIGSEVKTGGFVLGVDHCFSSRVFFGGGASYSTTFLDWKESRGDGHIHEILGGLYASYVDQRFFVNLTALAGVNLYDLHRRIKFSTISRSAESSSYGYEISPHVGVGVNLLPERFSTALQLFGDADYFYFNRKRFQEFGAQSLNLDVRTKTSNMMRSEVGARLNHTVTKQGGCFAPYIGLSWVGKYHLSSGSYNASLDQVPRIFTVFSFDKNIFFISPEAGLQITLKDGFSFSADYKGEFGHYGHVNKVDLRLNWLY